MNLQKRQKEQTQLTPVERLSQESTVQALAVKRFDEASRMLPSRIEGTFDLPKIREMILATNEQTVSGFVEFELIKLAERINVSGNLTPGQVEFVATQLIGAYPNETIADFKLCFERGSAGAYGKIWKLDGVEIGNWMKSYLDEKYQVMEAQLMKEKDEHYKRPAQNTDWLKLWQEAVEKSDKEGGVKTTSKNISFLNHLRALTPEQIKREGQETPKRSDLYKAPHPPEYYAMKDKIRREASEFYKNRYSFSKMSIYTVGEHEVFAESIDDAEAIYQQAITK